MIAARIRRFGHRCIASAQIWQHVTRQAHSTHLDSRNRLVKGRQDEADEAGVSKKTRRLQSAASGGLALSGVLLVGYHYFDAIATAGNIGFGLIAAGGVSLLMTSKHPISERFWQKSSSKFTFKVINDATLFSAERDQLERTAPIMDTETWPLDIQKKLQEYRRRDVRLLKENIMTRRAAMAAALPEPGHEFSSEREALSAMAPRAFVLDYIAPQSSVRQLPDRKDQRSRAELLGEEVSMLIACASKRDVVIINLSSPGGSVIEYGLAASHLLRLKKAGIRSIVTVDKVAASGGFMMACCADEIVAAPFAYLGSIGVIAELPNFHRVLNKNDVDYFMFTAGKFKRTVSLFNEVTSDGKDKFQDQLESIHTAFKQHVYEQRGKVMDVDKVATGEAWLALQCKEYGLVDRLGTSWDVIKEMADGGFDVIKVERETSKRNIFSSFRESGAAIFADRMADSVDRIFGHFNPISKMGSNRINSIHDIAEVRYATGYAGENNPRSL